MKCPKCGYNSFEYLASCKKCSTDLSAYKESLGMRPVVLPAFTVPPAVVAVAAPEPAASTVDAFSWDAPAESAPASEPIPFTAFAPTVEQAPAEDIAFAFSFDDLPAASAPAATETPAPSVWDTPSAAVDDGASFAGMIESINRDKAAPELPDAFSFDGLEGFETVDVAAPGAPAHDETAAAAPGGLDDLDKLFSEEENAD